MLSLFLLHDILPYYPTTFDHSPLFKSTAEMKSMTPMICVKGVLFLNGLTLNRAYCLSNSFPWMQTNQELTKPIAVNYFHFIGAFLKESDPTVYQLSYL